MGVVGGGRSIVRGPSAPSPADWPLIALQCFCCEVPLAADTHKFLLRTATFPRDGVNSDPVAPLVRFSSEKQTQLPGKDEALRDLPRFVTVRRWMQGGRVGRSEHRGVFGFLLFPLRSTRAASLCPSHASAKGFGELKGMAASQTTLFWGSPPTHTHILMT